jgi:hypothetical protein
MAVTNVPPDQLAQAWANNLGAATQRMQAGANAVTTSPGQLAAAQAQVWLANTTAAVNLWQQNTAAVTAQQWKDAYITKGLPRVGQGAQAAQASFAQTLGRIIAAEKSIVPGLPARGNLEANINRSAAFARAMNQLRGSFG